jgi:hypothetical protein
MLYLCFARLNNAPYRPYVEIGEDTLAVHGTLYVDTAPAGRDRPGQTQPSAAVPSAGGHRMSAATNSAMSFVATASSFCNVLSPSPSITAQ